MGALCINTDQTGINSILRTGASAWHWRGRHLSWAPPCQVQPSLQTV